MRKLDILTVTNMYNYLTGQFIYRYYHNLLPDLFDDYYIRTDSIHSRNTRQLSLFRLPQFKLNLAKRNLKYTGVKIWNHLRKIKFDLETSQPVFKYNLTRCFLQNKISLNCSKISQ